MEELLEQLHLVDQDLYFVMGALPGSETAELIITAEGNISAFPAVVALVKPAQGCDFVIRHEGARIDVKQTHHVEVGSPGSPPARARDSSVARPSPSSASVRSS